jgi:hypothetical protein
MTLECKVHPPTGAPRNRRAAKMPNEQLKQPYTLDDVKRKLVLIKFDAGQLRSNMEYLWAAIGDLDYALTHLGEEKGALDADAAATVHEAQQEARD